MTAFDPDTGGVLKLATGLYALGQVDRAGPGLESTFGQATPALAASAAADPGVCPGSAS